MTGLQIKLVAGAVAVLALGLLLWSWHSRGQEIARLVDWRSQVVIAATDATVQPDSRGVRKSLAPNQVPASIAGLKRSLDSALDRLRQVNAETEAAKARADEADRRLDSEIANFEKRYAAAERRIAALDARKPAATPAESCRVVEIDSKAAWEGWR